MAGWGSIIAQLLRLCCGSSQEPQGQQQQQQQQQQHQYQQQQQHPQQQQQYPPPQAYGYNQQQAAYPPQPPPQQSWASVAGGQQHQQNHKLHHQHHQQQHQQQQQQQQQYQQQQNGGWQSQPQQNGYAPSKPYSLPSGGVVGPHHPGYQNQDQVNATNAHYTDLRNRARQEGDEAHKCFAESQQAYQSGDGARAHQLSLEGKEHQRKQDELDDQASGWIFSENNNSSPPDTIDLHGLYVKEAIERTEAAINDSQRQGRDTLRVIVGKGIHSQNHVAKIKPAVEELMQKYNLSAHIDPENTGVLIVDLTGRQGGARSRDAGGIVDQLGEQEGCRIM